MHRNFYPNTHFFNYTVQGYVNKATEEKSYKLFSKQKITKRYLVIDFTKSSLQIKEKKESNEANKTIMFRHLTNGYAQKNEAANITGEFYFVLNTAERKFVLSTNTEEDRSIWIKAINFIVMTTKLV